MIRRIFQKVLRKKSNWYDDLCEYYGVTPEQAKELATRRPARRPNLPGSSTTHAVSGMTFEEIWDMRPRNTPEAIHQFYKDMGAWATFRQCYYRRNLDASPFVEGLPDGAIFCEYGSGVAPITNWIVENVRGRTFELTITDVPSEHLTFAKWRLTRKIEARNLPFRLQLLEVGVNTLPLKDEYDTITILEVFEHLYNPYEVARHLTEHLRRGGRLWENYPKSEPCAADLKEAQQQRAAVFNHIRTHYKLMSGADPDEAPGATRCWVKL